ncbi:MAG: hypothetical protein JAY84_08935 [Candidatus Thiodiazotropha taylori]|nr:hypothetical protein [Candidatus Thiodiazotropha taylori]
MNAYLFSYNSIIPQHTVQEILNRTSAVETWVAPISSSAIVLSRLSVAELAAVLHTHLGETWFLLVEATPQNSNGWLPANFWEYISNPDATWSKQILADLTKKAPVPGLGLLGNPPSK